MKNKIIKPKFKCQLHTLRKSMPITFNLLGQILHEGFIPKKKNNDNNNKKNRKS